MNALKNFRQRYGREIGAIAIGVSAFATATLASRAYASSLDVLLEEHMITGTPQKEISLKRKFELTWRYWLPVAGAAAATTYSIWAFYKGGVHRERSITSAYALALDEFRRYRERAVSEGLLEPKDDAALLDGVRTELKDYANRKNAPHASEPVWVYDALLGRKFQSTQNELLAAQNAIDEDLIHFEGASLNDFYEQLELPPAQLGDQIGWVGGSRIELRMAPILFEGLPMIEITFGNAPSLGYDTVTPRKIQGL